MIDNLASYASILLFTASNKWFNLSELFIVEHVQVNPLMSKLISINPGFATYQSYRHLTIQLKLLTFLWFDIFFTCVLAIFTTMDMFEIHYQRCDKKLKSRLKNGNLGARDEVVTNLFISTQIWHITYLWLIKRFDQLVSTNIGLRNAYLTTLNARKFGFSSRLPHMPCVRLCCISTINLHWL